MRYYPNNWQAIKDTPPEWFESIDYDTFMEWKMDGWEFPTSVFCMIRTRNCETDKVTEYIYQSKSAAAKKVNKILKDMDSEFTVCTHEYVSFMKPEKYITDGDKENYV